MREWSVLYNDVIDKLQTGDVILFHEEAIDNRIVQYFERSPWSHVGMVVKSEDIGFDNAHHPLLIWEAMRMHLFVLEDIKLGAKKSGPQLVDLHERLTPNKYADSMFAIRQLNIHRTPQMMQQLKEFINYAHKTSFPTMRNVVKLFLNARLFNKEAKLDKFFCSELIAETYIRLGILSPKYSPNYYNPADFSSDHELPLINGAQLGDEILFIIQNQAATASLLPDPW